MLSIHYQPASSSEKAAFQASVDNLKKIADQRYLRRVPTQTEAGALDCPWSVKDSKVKIEIDATSQWHDMIGPIGIYYIWMTGKLYSSIN